MNYIEESNPWSSVLLEDGTKIRYRWVVTSIESQGIGSDGLPQYKIDWAQVYTVDPEKKILIEDLTKYTKDEK